jgi:hypothetical protein
MNSGYRYNSIVIYKFRFVRHTPSLWSMVFLPLLLSAVISECLLLVRPSSVVHLSTIIAVGNVAASAYVMGNMMDRMPPTSADGTPVFGGFWIIYYFLNFNSSPITRVCRLRRLSGATRANIKYINLPKSLGCNIDSCVRLAVRAIEDISPKARIRSYIGFEFRSADTFASGKVRRPHTANAKIQFGYSR